MNDLPGKFVNRINKLYGKAGKVWLEGFSDLRNDLRKRWSLSNYHPIPEISYNYLEFAKASSGRKVVLKMGVPDPELDKEIAALKIYNGSGAVKLIDVDQENGALLLERIEPGHNLISVCDDDNATSIAGQVMLDLWCPAPEEDDFPTMNDWLDGFKRYRLEFQDNPGPVPELQLQRAAVIAGELLGDKPELQLLHGDLHHLNILLGPEGKWLAIDPKGVIGEKEFEIGPLLYNPIPALMQQPDVLKIIVRRLEIMSETTGLDQSRILKWSYVRTVLTAIWEIEDGGDNWDYWVNFGFVLENIL